MNLYVVNHGHRLDFVLVFAESEEGARQAAFDHLNRHGVWVKYTEENKKAWDVDLVAEPEQQVGVVYIQEE